MKTQIYSLNMLFQDHTLVEKIVIISTPEGTSNLLSILEARRPPSYGFLTTTAIRHPNGKYVRADEVVSIDDLDRLEKRRLSFFLGRK